MSFQQNHSHLLRRTSLQEGEYLRSLIARLEVLNGYDSQILIYKIYQNQNNHYTSRDIDLWNPTEVSSYARLTELTQIEANELYMATYHRFSELLIPPSIPINKLTIPSGETLPCITHQLHRYFHSDYSVTWCPQCLAEAPYHRLIWMVKSVSVCLKHMCLLNIGCPICRIVLSIRDVVAGCCPRCRTTLAKIPAHPINFDNYQEYWSQQLLQDWLLEIDRTDIYLDSSYRPKRTLYYFIYGLQSSLHSVSYNWPFLQSTSINIPPNPYARAKFYRSPEDAYIRYATACKSIMNWPHGFHDFLDAYSERDYQKQSISLITRLGVIYSHWIEKNWSNPAFQFIQEAFDQYLINRHASTPTIIRSSRYRTNATLYKEFGYITVAEAARLLRVSPITIKQLIETGRLIPASDDATRDYPAIFIRRAEVNELRQRWSEKVTLVKTAELLGISPEVALDLVKINLLIAERGPSVDGSSQWWFLRSQVRMLLEHLSQHISETTVLTGFVDLANAARILKVVELNAAQILQLVCMGRMKAYRLTGSTTRLDQLRFAVCDIRTYIDAIKDERNWLNKKQVIGLLSINIPTLQRWIDAELLSPVSIIGNVSYYDRQAIYAFKSRYITTDEAANLLEIVPLTIQTWARQGRLTPISGPEVDGCHNYRFDKEALLAWRYQRLTFGEAMKLLGVSKATLHRWVEQGKLIPLEDMGGMQRWFARSEVENLRGRV